MCAQPKLVRGKCGSYQRNVWDGKYPTRRTGSAPDKISATVYAAAAIKLLR